MKVWPRTIVILVVLVMVFGCGSAVAESEPSEDPPTPAPFSVPGFRTDFTKMIIEPTEILSGGPPKDGIPAVDNPRHESVEAARGWMDGREPVILLTVNGESRIYPIAILTWHEIVNDELGGDAVAVSFCPLCNTGVVFSRAHRGDTLDFGTTGHLSSSNLLMYDRQTESWWQQATGQAVIGEYAGDVLTFVPSLTLSLDDAVRAQPEATVLSRSTGFSRSYGRNPYVGYDAPGNKPFLFHGFLDPYPMDRVVVVMHGNEEKIVSYAEVEPEGVLSLRMDGDPVVLFWTPGTASALDSGRIADGRDVGSLNGFLARHEGYELIFKAASKGQFTDTATGTLWDGSGRAVDGPLTGAVLEPVVAVQHFSFSARVFSVAP